MTEDFGQQFHRLRKARGITLQALADSQCSASFISKFERGERQITVVRFLHLLNRINVPIEEFMFTRRQQQPTSVDAKSLNFTSPYIPVFEAIRSADKQLDVRRLSQREIALLEEVGATAIDSDGGQARWQKFARLYRALIVKVAKTNFHADADINLADFMTELTTMVRPITAYLYSVDEWGTFELTLLRFFVVALDVETVYRFTLMAVKRSHATTAMPQIYALLMGLLRSAVSKCLNTNRLQWATTLLGERETLNSNGSSDIALENKFLRGWLTVATGDEQTGIRTCQQVVAVYRQLGLTKKADEWQDRVKMVHLSHNAPNEYAMYL